MSLSQFQAIGRALGRAGLISGASGNLSIRLEDKLLITRTGSLLTDLGPGDIIQTGLFSDDIATSLASSELAVHRAIYKSTSALAIVHAHPPGAVAMSLIEKALESAGQGPVLGKHSQIVPGAMAEEIARELKNHPLVMVKGHGSFAVARTLGEACKITISFEQECALWCLQNSIPLHRAIE